MSKAAWVYLHEVYTDAWRVRLATGDSSPAVLTNAAERIRPPLGVPELTGQLSSEPFLEFWNRGVEPTALKVELYRELGKQAWRATVVPAMEVWKHFR